MDELSLVLEKVYVAILDSLTLLRKRDILSLASRLFGPANFKFHASVIQLHCIEVKCFIQASDLLSMIVQIRLLVIHI